MLGMGWGAGTVLNALATGIGCAFGISLRTVCEIEPVSAERVGAQEDIKEELVRDLLSLFPGIDSVKFKIESTIPPTSGLGSSSAFVNSILTALNRISENLDPEDIPEINSKISKKHDISYTGAFDDACASFYGGLVLTDNESLKIILRMDFERYCAILLPPWSKKSIEVAMLRENNERLHEAVNYVKDGDVGKAMEINSRFYCERLGYPVKPVELALRYVDEAGLSGNGPAYICLGEREDVEKVVALWSDFGEVIICKTVNTGVLEFLKRGKDMYDG